jgi:hypothetical protein
MAAGPRVDVLFKGTRIFPAPMTEVDVAVRVGTRMQKAARQPPRLAGSIRPRHIRDLLARL